MTAELEQKETKPAFPGQTTREHDNFITLTIDRDDFDAVCTFASERLEFLSKSVRAKNFDFETQADKLDRVWGAAPYPEDVIEFDIPVEVLAKQGSNKSQAGVYYTKAKWMKNARALAVHCHGKKNENVKGKCVHVDLLFKTPWIQKQPKKNRPNWLPKNTRPDCDNLSKQMLDVLEKVGLLKDDARAFDLHLRKVWCDEEGVRIRIYDFKE